MSTRTATLERDTKETKINATICLDGNGESNIDTGIGFFDHMLDLFTRHGGFDLTVKAVGDLRVDGHHTVEDIGIVLGKMIGEALGDKRGICRYGNATIPMDETLATCALDISGRPFLVMNTSFTSEKCGEFATELVEEFFRAVSFNAGITLHLAVPYGTNDHHKIEAMFKAFARALRMAVAVDTRFADSIPSTKGML
ncbi:MAG TPA: imidazoleglycerol-phosphate dehydratase HisB [Bacillota bacterium]|nr:imidazoleglycerol-phosphate dehydratase HisB [Bacillota bacterium]HPE38618.1 imidazoleglycerol-phosphate dehydratase HisB [Bacillota bacterium]